MQAKVCATAHVSKIIGAAVVVDEILARCKYIVQRWNHGKMRYYIDLTAIGDLVRQFN
jgi:hypothetical protein